MRFVLLAALVLAIGAAPAAADTTINLTDQTFACNRALSDYGDLPIHVNLHWTQTNVTEFGVRLERNCMGIGNDGPPQLIFSTTVEEPGDGPYGDGLRVVNANGANQPRSMVVSGTLECGRTRQTNHADGIQAIGGKDITFDGLLLGTGGPDNNPSCFGAGAGLFFSSANCPGENCVVPVNMVVKNSVISACHTGLREGSNGQSGAVIDTTIRFRSDLSNPLACLDNNGNKLTGGPCMVEGSPDYVVDVNVTCDQWPFGGSPPPPPPPPAPPPAPPPPPCSGICPP